jgi:hypothetical protein
MNSTAETSYIPFQAVGLLRVSNHHNTKQNKRTRPEYTKIPKAFFEPQDGR